MPDSDFTPALEEFHTVRLKRRSASEQMRHALQAIRDSAATKENGGAWAAGVAILCLGTLPEA